MLSANDSQLVSKLLSIYIYKLYRCSGQIKRHVCYCLVMNDSNISFSLTKTEAQPYWKGCEYASSQGVG